MDKYDEISLRNAALSANAWLWGVFAQMDLLTQEMDKMPERWEHECIDFDAITGRPVIVARKVLAPSEDQEY